MSFKNVLFGFVGILCLLSFLSWSDPCIVETRCVHWNANDACDNLEASSGNYGCPFDLPFKNVVAYSNGGWTGRGIGRDSIQCVGLVKRFYARFFGNAINQSVGTADSLYVGFNDRDLKRFGLEIFINGGSVAPRVGDMIVFSGGANGHVAIFCGIIDDKARIFEQNVSTVSPFRDFNYLTSGGTYTIQGSTSYPVLGWVHLAVGGYSDGFHLDASGNALDISSKAFIDAFKAQPKFKVGDREWFKIGWPNSNNGGPKDVHLYLGQTNSSFGVIAQDFIQDDLSKPHYGTDGKSILILNDLEVVNQAILVSGGFYGHYCSNDGPYNYGVPFTSEIQGYYSNSPSVSSSDFIQPNLSNSSGLKRITVQKFKRRLVNGTYYNEERKTLVYNPDGPANDAGYNVRHFPVGQFSIGEDKSPVPDQWYIMGGLPSLDIPWPILGVKNPTGKWFIKPGTYTFVRHNASGGWLAGSSFTATITEGNYQFAGNSASDVFIPQNVSIASMSRSSLTIIWDKLFDTTGVTYNVYRSLNQSSASSILVGTTANNSFCDVGLSPSTNYYYWVKAVVGSQLSEFSNSANATTQNSAGNGATPTSPTNLACAFVNNHQVNVSWSLGSNSADNIGDYKLFMGTANNSAQAVYTAITPFTSQVISGLDSSLTYYFWVKAVNHVGVESSFSSSVSVAMSNYIYPPVNLVAVNSNGSIQLSWTCQSSGVNFTVYRSTSVNFSSQTIIQQSGGTSCVDASGQSGTTYYYRVSSYSSGRVSDYSNAVSAVPATFSAPDSFRVAEVGSDRVRLAWNRSPGTIYNYWVFRYLNGTQQWVNSTTDTFFIDSTVVAGYTYSYKIRARSNTTSAISNEVFATTRPKFVYSGAWVCDSVVDGPVEWSKRALNIKNNFSQGSKASLLVELKNIFINYRQKVDIYYNGVYSWTWGNNQWSDVGQWGWSYSYATPSISDCQPGVYEFKVYLDTGSGYWQVDSKSFTVSGSALPYTYSGAWVCDSTEDGAIQWSKNPVNIRNTFVQGDGLACLVVFKDLSVNHRVKVDIYKDGIYSWTWGSGEWNVVNGILGYFNAIVQMQNVPYGNYEFRIFIDIGNGYQQVDFKTCQVLFSGLGYTYSGSWTCDSVADGFEEWSKIAISPKSNFLAGQTINCLSVFRNVSVNHRVKVDIYQNGYYSWTWGDGSWNYVGGYTWSYLNAVVANAQVSAGQYEFRIYIDTGLGYQLVDVKSVNVSSN